VAANEAAANSDSVVVLGYDAVSRSTNATGAVSSALTTNTTVATVPTTDRYDREVSWPDDSPEGTSLAVASAARTNIEKWANVWVRMTVPKNSGVSEAVSEKYVCTTGAASSATTTAPYV
jgi:hypothetical protein